MSEALDPQLEVEPAQPSWGEKVAHVLSRILRLDKLEPSDQTERGVWRGQTLYDNEGHFLTTRDIDGNIHF